MRLIDSTDREDSCSNITIIPREHWIIISSHITPVYCSRCAQQIDGLYEYTGSRYGAIGHVKCNSCGDDIYCWDKDVGWDVLYCRNVSDPDEKDTEINLPELYALTSDVFNALERAFGQIFKRRVRRKYHLKRLFHSNFVTSQEIYMEDEWSLQQLIGLIYIRTGLSKESIPQKELTLDPRFPRMPSRIQEWLSLLSYLGVISA